MQQHFVTDNSRITRAAVYVPNKQDEQDYISPGAPAPN